MGDTPATDVLAVAVRCRNFSTQSDLKHRKVSTHDRVYQRMLNTAMTSRVLWMAVVSQSSENSSRQENRELPCREKHTILYECYDAKIPPKKFTTFLLPLWGVLYQSQATATQTDWDGVCELRLKLCNYQRKQDLMFSPAVGHHTISSNNIG